MAAEEESPMECVVEAVSSTRKKLVLTLSADDVNAALNAAVTAYRKDLSLPGFRKGKVPAATIEHRFGEEIASKATQDALNEAIQKALADNKLAPLSGMDLDNQEVFKRNEAFACAVSFDVLPDITFPEYTGMEVDQTKVVVTDADRKEILDQLRGNLAELTDVTEARLPEDGDVVDVDYSGTDENGAPVDDVKGEHFSVTLGQGQALPDFEALVKATKVGEEKSGPVVFPEDYGHKPLAGKTVTFTIRVNSLKSRNLPEVDEAFAKKVGSESLEKLHQDLDAHIESGKQQAARNEALQKLLDRLMEGQTFDIPAGLLNARVDRILQERAMRLQRMGKSLEELGKKPEELRAEAEAEALETLRPQVLLMALGLKENVTVSEQDVEMAIYTMAMRAHEDYQKVREAYHRSGLVHELRDRLLADKAIELVYSKAKINEVEPAAN